MSAPSFNATDGPLTPEDEIVIEVWPRQITQWRCPVCGLVLDGKSYNIDTSRKKCTKLWHRAMAVGRHYRLVEPDDTGVHVG